MRITLICCPFQTSYGSYAGSLKAALERKLGGPVNWLAANCGCGDPIEVERRFQTPDCTYFELPVPGGYRSSSAWKRVLRGKARDVSLYLRARRYANLCKHAELVHFQQILNGYGSKAVFHWLRQPSTAVRVVTVHELDADQLERPDTNLTYNLADAVIVHCEEMREQLVRLHVESGRIYVALYGAGLPTGRLDGPRAGVVFYGGHKLASGKGLDTLLQAVSLMERCIPDKMPEIKIHGHYGTEPPADAIRLARDIGVAERITWLNQISNEEMAQLYLSSQLCALPYTSGFAGLPAALAAACALPVVCTSKAALTDHLGSDGIWVDTNDPERLADCMMALLADGKLSREIGARLRKRAELFLSWDVIADRTLEIYAKAMARKPASPGRAA
ncbi:MAG: glycosyltransferase family 4 protein [Acidobacteria bacterium]|nr:glycosyltransferase family 4 protein [Acidobacteriota bacterium]